MVKVTKDISRVELPSSVTVALIKVKMSFIFCKHFRFRNHQRQINNISSNTNCLKHRQKSYSRQTVQQYICLRDEH